MRLLLLLFLLFPLPLFAQEGGLHLVTSPLPISLSAEPGKTISTELKVRNAGTEPENLQISVMKFRAYEDTGKPALIEREVGDDFFDWVSFSEPTFTLAPNEWKTIEATFTLPESAAFGYYYAFVFSRAAENIPKEKETAFVGGTAVLVLLDAVVPNARREVHVTNFSTDRKFYEFLPTTFEIDLENVGNVHVSPRGNIFIARGTEKDVALLEVNPERGNILPESSRTFEAQWKDGFPVHETVIMNDKVVFDKNGRPEVKLAYDWNKASQFRFGKYTATLLLTYDDGKRDIPIEGKVSFWVIPWRGLLIGFVLALLVSIGVRSTIFALWAKIFKAKPTQVS